jgi:hypothetical protein
MISLFGDQVETEFQVARTSKNQERGAMKRVFQLFLLAAVLASASCGYQAPSTAVTCTTSTPTASTTTTVSTCTDPVTQISITISPATVSVNVVTIEQFFAAIQGGTNNVAIWKVNNITGGNSTVGQIDSNGVYHAPTSVPSPATVSVTATSFEDQILFATSMVTIVPAPTVTITSPSAPITISSGAANTVNFTATETGGTTNTLLWSVAPLGGLGVLGGNATLGTITANGVYSPPATPPIGQTVTVNAAAQDAPGSTASLNVTISGYSTSSLQGQFAFSLSGSNSSGHFFRAGSFAADGVGHLNSVLEDTNTSAGATSTPISTTGTYTVAADGRGTFEFNDGLSPATFNFVLVNNGQLQIIGFDATGTAVGQANAQVPSSFSGLPLSALSGTYVFDFAGVHGTGGLSQIGEFTADGAGNITSGSADINDSGAASPLLIYGSKTVCVATPQPPAPPLSAYSLSSNGRGVLTLTTLQTVGPNLCVAGPTLTLNFYVVSGGSAEFVGTDPTLQVAGYTSQQNPNATFGLPSLNGSFAFLLAGSATTGPIATAGSLTADGNGNITSGVLDENVNGTPALGLALIPGLYTLAANGRGTLSFSTSGRTYSLIFYVGATGNSANAVVQDIDAGIASDGSLARQQSSALTLASIQGNYAIQTSGAMSTSAQVITGELTADGAGNIPAGKIDLNTAGALTAGEVVTGSYSAPAATGRSTLALNSGTPNFSLYVVSPTQVYVVGIAAGQVAAGSLLRQF